MGAEQIAGLILAGLNSLQQLAQLQATVAARGTPATLDELKALRAADLSVRDQLEAAIAAHPDAAA